MMKRRSFFAALFAPLAALPLLGKPAWQTKKHALTLTVSSRYRPLYVRKDYQWIAGSVGEEFVESNGFIGYPVSPANIRILINGVEFPEASDFDSRTRTVGFVRFNYQHAHTDPQASCYVCWEPGDAVEFPKALKNRMPEGAFAVFLTVNPDEAIHEGFYRGPFTVTWSDESGKSGRFECL